jgi:hypothetical protein
LDGSPPHLSNPSWYGKWLLHDIPNLEQAKADMRGSNSQTVLSHPLLFSDGYETRRFHSLTTKLPSTLSFYAGRSQIEFASSSVSDR